MKIVTLASLFLVMVISPFAYADKLIVPSRVGEMLQEDSNFALIKNVEIKLTPLSKDIYLLNLSKIPKVRERLGEIMSIASETAACLADHLSFKSGKKFWSVGHSSEAEMEYETNNLEQLDYYVVFGNEVERPLRDIANREIDIWNDRDKVYPPFGYKKRRCEPYRIKPEWMSSWETFRAPVEYFNVAGEKLPNRIWAFQNQEVLDSWSKDEEMLSIINAEVTVQAISPKLYSLKLSFDPPASGMAAMYSLMFFPSCLADYLSSKNGFELSDVGATNSSTVKPSDKSANSEDISSIEYFLLFDLRENEPRPIIGKSEKINWIGSASSFGLLRAAHANITSLCKKTMATQFLSKP